MPGVYLPQGGLMQATEDADLVVEGLAIVERDGFYEQGEMEGEITPPDLDAVDAAEEAAAIGGTWPGEVRHNPVSSRLYYVELWSVVGVDVSLRAQVLVQALLRRFCRAPNMVPESAPSHRHP